MVKKRIDCNLKTAFFTSTGRTGTDFFTVLFNDFIKNSWSLHEPKPAFRRRAMRLISSPPTLYDVQYFRLPRIWRHSKQKCLWYVETNYHLSSSIPVVRRAFPGALVFHIVRDGREVVTSWLNRFRYITNDHITPYNVPGDPAQALWPQWNPVQKLAWYWKTVNETAERNSPDMILRFEEIFRGEKKGCFAILDKFEGIEYDRKAVEAQLNVRVNLNKRDFFPNYPEWPTMWKDQFWEIAGEGMKKYGYGERESSSLESTG